MKVGQVGGDAGLEQGLSRTAVPVGVGLEEVDAREAVDLEVDEARARRSLVRSGETRP